MLFKKLLNRTLLSLTGLMVATASQAFDAGASDPNFREFDSLVGGTGSDTCRLEVGYLTASQNLTQLLIVTKRPTPYNQYHYNGGYYRSSNDTWSSDETNYFRDTTGVDADLTTVSPSTLASDCGWTSASITDLTPSSNFAANGTAFANAESASIRLDYIYNGRSFSATASISGAANAIPIAQTIYTGTPGAPTTLVATPQDGAASIAFTATTDLPSGAGESANDIINYEYSLDGGQNWLAIPAVTTSPVTISGLTNGTTYSVTLRAINTIGTGITSSSVAVTPVDTTTPTIAITAAEVSDGDTSADATLALTFTTNEATTDFAVDDITVVNGALSSFAATSSTVYEATFTPTAAGATTIDVAPSTFTDAAGNANTAATQFNWTYDATAVTSPNSPTAMVATSGDGQVSVAFTAPSNDGGAAITDYQYELDDSGTWTSASTATSPVVITGLTNGTAYSIKLRAVNSVGSGAESAAVSVLLGSPASEFAAKEATIRSVITSDAQRSLSNALSSNTRLTRKARERFLTSRAKMQDGNTTAFAFRNNEAFDIDGAAVASADQIATRGNFFAQTGNFEGTQRRLVSGDFDLQRDTETGSTTATINGKIAWEQMLSKQAMLGYYLGGEVSRSNIKGSFAGTQDRYGVSVGGYFVQALQENLFLEGFASLGVGRNDLKMADDTLDLTSDYTTQTATLGAAVSGVIEQTGYDILPELSITYGKTTIGNVGFTGVAYGLTDDTLSLDAGSVSTATIMFRPEFRVPMDGLAASERQFSL